MNGLGTLDATVIVRTAGERGRFLERALRSVQAQSRAPRAVVVVGDGVDEGQLRERVAEFRCATVALAQARGRAGAANAGLAHVYTTWWTMLDDDDTWDAEFIAAMAERAEPREGDAGFGGVVCRTTAVYEMERNGGLVELGREPFNPDLAAVDTVTLVRSNRFTINAALWHRRVLEALGGFRADLPVLEDWEFNVRAVRRFELGVLPRALAHYHLRPPRDRAPNSDGREHDRVARRLRKEWRALGVGQSGWDRVWTGWIDGVRQRWARRCLRRRWARWLRMTAGGDRKRNSF